MVHETQVNSSAAQAWISRPASPVTSAAGEGTGPLAGLRFAAKDNIDAAGLPTTAACPA
jgi:allophanate hydrolase